MTCIIRLFGKYWYFSDDKTIQHCEAIVAVMNIREEQKPQELHRDQIGSLFHEFILLHFTLAKAEKYRTHSNLLNDSKNINVAYYAAAVRNTVGV